jgi:hypothetical protein
MHACNSICRALELEVEEGDNNGGDQGEILGGPNHPLRIGFN